MIFVIVGCIALAGFVPEWRKYTAHEERLEELLDDKARAESRLQELRVQQDRFQNDRDYVRKVAHEIGLVEDHEVVFRFYDENRNSARR